MHLGFACEWENPRERTWSHTPSSLVAALRRTDGVVVEDIDGHLPVPLLALTKLLSLRYQSHSGRLGSQFMFSSLHRDLVQRTMLRRIRAVPDLDAVICCSDDLRRRCFVRAPDSLP